MENLLLVCKDIVLSEQVGFKGEELLFSGLFSVVLSEQVGFKAGKPKEVYEFYGKKGSRLWSSGGNS